MLRVEVARFLRIVGNMVDYYRKEGKLTPVGRNRKGWHLYDPQEVERFAEIRMLRFVEAGPPVKSKFQEELEHRLQLEALDAQIAGMFKG